MSPAAPRTIAWIEDSALSALLERVGVPPTPSAPRYAPEAHQATARVPDGLKLRRQLHPASPPPAALEPLAPAEEVSSDAAALGEVWTRLHEAQQGIFEAAVEEAPEPLEEPSPERPTREVEPEPAAFRVAPEEPAGEEDEDEDGGALPGDDPEAGGLGLALEGLLDDEALDDLPALPPSAAAALEEALHLLQSDPRVEAALLVDEAGEPLVGPPELVASLGSVAASALAAAERAAPGATFVALGLADGRQLLASPVESPLATLVLVLVLVGDGHQELATLGGEVVADALASLLAG